MKEAGAEPNGVAKDGVKGEEENTRKGALCHARLMKMVCGLKGDEKSGADHDEAKKKRAKFVKLRLIYFVAKEIPLSLRQLCNLLCYSFLSPSFTENIIKI